MPSNHYFWKRAQNQQPRKPSLSEIYSTILESQRVAIFSQDVQDPSVPPEQPSSNAKMLGIVSKDYANRIERDSQLSGPEEVSSEGGKKKSLLQAVVEDKVGISSPNFVRNISSSLRSIMVDSGYPHIGKLLRQILSGNGIFSIFDSSEYNAIQTVINQLPSELKNEHLEGMLLRIFENTTKFGSTNVGPGELFFSLFTDAKVAGASAAKNKSGDLEVGNLNVEVKSTDARYGGDRYCLAAFENIQKALKGIYKSGRSVAKDKQLAAERLLLELKHFKEDNRLTPTEKFQKFIEYYTNYIPSLHRQNRGPFQTVLTKIQRGLKDSFSSATFDTMVKSDFQVMLGGRKGGVPLYSLMYNVIGSLKKLQTEEENSSAALKFDSRLDNVLASAFESIKESKPNIDYEELIDLILFVNNYNPRTLEQRSGYNIKEDLKQTLGQNVGNILNLSLQQIETLIGAMHLTSYTNYTKYDKLMMLNKLSGSVFIVDAPNTLKEGLAVCNNPNIKIEAIIDNPQSKTAVGFSAMISYTK
jgi:hypothetical protein